MTNDACQVQWKYQVAGSSKCFIRLVLAREGNKHTLYVVCWQVNRTHPKLLHDGESRGNANANEGSQV